MSVSAGDRSAPSVTGIARRSQIVAAMIDVIAELGFGQASFARIAERAGVSSTRLISYHFAGKDELITAVAEDVIASIGDYSVAGRRRNERHRKAAGLHRGHGGVHREPPGADEGAAGDLSRRRPPL